MHLKNKQTNWGMVALQCTMKWNSYMCTRVPSLVELPPASVSLLQVSTELRAELPVPYSSFPLAICFTLGSAKRPVSTYHLISPLPPCPLIHSLHLHSYSANSFICNIFVKFFKIIIIFSFIFISWRLISLQYCSVFCHTLTWVSHGFTCVPHPDPPSRLPPHPIPLGLPSAPALSTCLIHPTWAGDLFHPW